MSVVFKDSLGFPAVVGSVRMQLAKASSDQVWGPIRESGFSGSEMEDRMRDFAAALSTPLDATIDFAVSDDVVSFPGAL